MPLAMSKTTFWYTRVFPKYSTDAQFSNERPNKRQSTQSGTPIYLGRVSFRITGPACRVPRRIWSVSGHRSCCRGRGGRPAGRVRSSFPPRPTRHCVPHRCRNERASQWHPRPACCGGCRIRSTGADLEMNTFDL